MIVFQCRFLPSVIHAIESELSENANLNISSVQQLSIVLGIYSEDVRLIYVALLHLCPLVI
jgi:hypothetical protein